MLRGEALEACLASGFFGCETLFLFQLRFARSKQKCCADFAMRRIQKLRMLGGQMVFKTTKALKEARAEGALKLVGGDNLRRIGRDCSSFMLSCEMSNLFTCESMNVAEMSEKGCTEATIVVLACRERAFKANYGLNSCKRGDRGLHASTCC